MHMYNLFLWILFSVVWLFGWLFGLDKHTVLFSSLITDQKNWRQPPLLFRTSEPGILFLFVHE